MPDRPVLPRRPASVSGSELRLVLVALIGAAGLGALLSYSLAPEISLELAAGGEEIATWLAEKLEGLIWEFFNLAAPTP